MHKKHWKLKYLVLVINYTNKQLKTFEMVT